MAYPRKIQPNSYILKKEIAPRLAPVPLPVEPAPAPTPEPPAPTQYYWIAGIVQDGTSVPISGLAVEITGYGTALTGGSGTYTGVVTGGASGNITPHWFGGTFDPGQRTFSSIAADLPNQDFIFYATLPPPPPTPVYSVYGTVYNGNAGTLISGAGLEVTGRGTLISSAAGSYGFEAAQGFSGTTIPHYAGGTFDPSSYAYSNLGADQANQNFYFYFNPPPPPSDECPVPQALQTIPLSPTPTSLSRNVYDSANKLIWAIDDESTNVYYASAVYGTLVGTVTVPSGLQAGCAAIAYDSTTGKVLVTTYSEQLAFIDPVTKNVTFCDGGATTLRDPGIHHLVAENGTAWWASEREAYGGLVKVDIQAEVASGSYSFLPSGVYTDSIAWADNISKLVLMQSRPFGNWFWVFDPATGVFTPSGEQTTQSFNYENYYVKATGHMLMSRSGSSRVEVVDISLGASGSTIMSLDLNGGPNRISDACEDTCNSRLFVADPNHYVYEFSLDGNYTPIFFHDADGNFGYLNNIGLSHSRASNLVYYENWNDNQIHTLEATRNGGTLATMPWTNDPTIDQPWAGGVSYYAGQVGWFDGTSTGDDFNIQKTFKSDQMATLINLGPPIPVEVRTVYYGSMTDTGVVQLHSSMSLFQSMTGATSDSFSANTDGVFTGTLVCTGTINGWTQFEVSAQVASGGNLFNFAYEAFNVLNGTTTITPL